MPFSGSDDQLIHPVCRLVIIVWPKNPLTSEAENTSKICLKIVK